MMRPWSRCDSKICFIRRAEHPGTFGATQPRKRSCLIHTSLRSASIYTRMTKSRLTMFRSIFFLFSYPESSSAFEWPSRRIGATCCFGAEQTRYPKSLGSGVHLWEKHAPTAGDRQNQGTSHERFHIRVMVALIRYRPKRTTMNLTFDLPNRCRHPPTKSLRISRAGDGQKGARYGSHPFGSLATQAARA